MMTPLIRKLIFVLILTTAPSGPAFVLESANGLKVGWNPLESGLEVGIFAAPQPSEAGNAVINVLRIDPEFFRLRLLNASAAKKGAALSAKEWCLQNGLVAAINASMYQEDYRTSVSLMRTKGHINNPRVSKDMSILAFGRRREDIPRVMIIDRQCDDFEVWRNNYVTLVQSIRMISCKGNNVWAQQPKRWSTAAIATDTSGNVLFIHVRSPYSTHNLINILQKLPLNIRRMMYAEGGPQAQLFIRHKQFEHEYLGLYDPDLSGGNNLFARPIPNVVGIERRRPE